MTFLISLFSGIFTYIFLLYSLFSLREELFERSFNIKVFILIIILLLIGFYSFYLISQKRKKTIVFFVIISTVLNIILNFVLINYGLRFGMFEAVLGACFATIISRFIYFFGLVFWRKKGINVKGFLSPIILLQ